MPAIPEQLLSVRLTGAGRAILEALWHVAILEPEPWAAATCPELAEQTGFSLSWVERTVEQLREVGLIDRARRQVPGRRAPVNGWRLMRVPLRVQPKRRRAATLGGATTCVAKREQSQGKKSTRRDDMVIIAKMAKRGDSEVTIADRLVRARCKCSRGEWHKIKVHRRITEMRRELGLSGGMTAGDVAHRWAKVHDLDSLA